ncbi:type II toxin-antitoxin system RelE/ParE family toxin [Paraburkholderia mimosarum]|uniref:type II toxin-antitoxin system RelE/ParE family toxin n=1 Tax=Paraburkholderia mimosarum TaxID=312026 RepID=UPI00040F2D8A|nr:type II toxin-antitoxin system RelE/ParE family toxin [Paraburkholderia mimosarum]
MQYKVQYLPSFYAMLRNIEEYMVDHDRSDASIDRYRSAVFDTCEKFATFPNRGSRHDDVMSGLRTWNIEGETILAYVVDDAGLSVTFVGITYGGQNWMEIFSMRTLGPLQ